uniref:hypothetical protein n=1 Tax=uncultured Methanobrevibacter sp. TaxID=253161 RepID=UPI0026020A7A
MTSREERNKVLEDEIKKEQAINTSKKILKILFITILVFSSIYLYTYFIGVKFIKTHEYVIKDNMLPQSFNGIKILHFS